MDHESDFHPGTASVGAACCQSLLRGFAVLDSLSGDGGKIPLRMVAHSVGIRSRGMTAAAPLQPAVYVAGSCGSSLQHDTSSELLHIFTLSTTREKKKQEERKDYDEVRFPF
jgi:hypothetical protein